MLGPSGGRGRRRRTAGRACRVRSGPCSPALACTGSRTASRCSPAKDRRLAVDSGVYPVGRWAVQRAAGAWHARYLRVRHQNMADLTAGTRVSTASRHCGRSWSSNGMCTGAAGPIPLRMRCAGVKAHSGVLLHRRHPGTRRASGDRARRSAPVSAGVVAGRCLGLASRLTASSSVASLAKAFGAPVACVAGAAETWLRGVRHTSASSRRTPARRPLVDIAAAARALGRNETVRATQLRACLAARIRALRRRQLEPRAACCAAVCSRCRARRVSPSRRRSAAARTARRGRCARGASSDCAWRSAVDASGDRGSPADGDYGLPAATGREWFQLGG